MDAPANLRCEHQTEPLVLSTNRPFLSWQPPESGAQSAAQLRWNGQTSQWIQRADPFIQWPERGLTPFERIAWQVRTRFADGRESLRIWPETGVWRGFSVNGGWNPAAGYATASAAYRFGTAGYRRDISGRCQAIRKAGIVLDTGLKL